MEAGGKRKIEYNNALHRLRLLDDNTDRHACHACHAGLTNQNQKLMLMSMS